MGINIPPKLPEIVKLVPHQQQVASWDCGLACTSMVLTALGSRIYSPVELSNVIGVTSIWTIDVAYLLKRYGVEDFTYYTSYIGVNWDNIKSPFYNGDGTLQVDQPRIHSLFAAAKDAGVRVVQMILKLDDLRRFLRSERFVAIVLVDLNYIRCAVCAKRNRRGMHRRHHTRPTSKGGDKDEEFVGHYVLLVGYDPEEDIFLYRDPGTTAELCAMSADEMERARCASGTDHDCIVIRVR
ncbi:Guanylyl cyclase [Cladochytrium replicatum]|nr:Guanylyl cyclase [Cladochytrium replicatum]